MFVCSGFTTFSLGIDKERGQFTFIYSENKRFGFNMDGQTSSILFIPNGVSESEPTMLETH